MPETSHNIASREFIIYFPMTAPHIHTHHYFTDEEIAQIGHGVVEICCHACDTRILMTVPPTDDTNVNDIDVIQHTVLRFTQNHAECAHKLGIEKDEWLAWFNDKKLHLACAMPTRPIANHIKLLNPVVF